VTATQPFCPLVVWDRVPSDAADAALEAWGHWLGGCSRPFGRQDWGLWLEGELVAVAVSASTVNRRCAGYERQEVVELARLCAHPGHRDLTRVALRLWRKTAASAWAAKYWPVRAYVSYSNALRHRGDIYRFDGWRKVADVRGSAGGGNWGHSKVPEPKSVWVYALDAE
jgi:hypothetical protein